MINAMSITSVVITPITSPSTPFATVEEPISTSIYTNKKDVNLILDLLQIYANLLNTHFQVARAADIVAID